MDGERETMGGWSLTTFSLRPLLCSALSVCSGAFTVVAFTGPFWAPVNWELERRAAEKRYESLRGVIA